MGSIAQKNLLGQSDSQNNTCHNMLNLILVVIELNVDEYRDHTGADPGCLDRGFKLAAGVRFVEFDQFFLKFPMKMKQFRLKRGFV